MEAPKTEQSVEEVLEIPYQPSEKERRIVDFIYKEVDYMWKKRTKSYPEFNDRTLEEYIDDSSKRLNSYVEDKSSAGKDDWQANVALPTIRNKLKRLLAGFSLTVPEMNLKAYGEDNSFDVDRSDIAEDLIRGSYIQEENPVLENFWEAWECAGKGTVVKYEGYLRTRYEQRYIESFDYVTGEVEFDTREVDVDDNCVSVIVPLVEFFIKDYRVPDVQDQTAVCWLRYYTEEEFEREFGQYGKAKYVKTKAYLSPYEPQTFFYKRWSDRVDNERMIEVVRYYNKYQDRYAVVANGVLILDVPLLWEVNGKKAYPFAKAPWEPFEGKHFFYGKSLPDVLTGQYDILNTLWNTIMDKEFRNLERPLLLGIENQDAFELEDEFVSHDTKIYVDDVDQVKPMPIDGVNNADVQMLQLVARGIEEASPSMPNLLSKKRTTAREVVIAEEKMKELKGIHQAMLADLWRQKYYLRLSNIKLHYPQKKKIIDKDGNEKEVDRVFIIPNSLLDKKTGERGILAVQFTDITKKNRRELQEEAGVEEEMMRRQGINYKKIHVDRHYLDNRRISIEVVPEVFHKTSMARKQATSLEKLQAIRGLFPEVFVVNKEELYSELADAYGDDPGPELKKLREFNRKRREAAQGAQSPAAGGGGVPQAVRRAPESPPHLGGAIQGPGGQPPQA